MQTIATLVSGGDAPGINAALTGILQTAASKGIHVLSLAGGYNALLNRTAPVQLADRLVQGQALHEGSYLESGRCAEFRNADFHAAAVTYLRELEVDGLITIGGDGTAAGALALSQLGMPTLSLPLTIDNDVHGTVPSLGFHTCVQAITQVLDDTLQTARTYQKRIFWVETMGGPTGHLSLAGGLSGGADLILLPEFPASPATVATVVKGRLDAGAPWVTIVASEGIGDTYVSGRQNIAKKYGDVIAQTTGIRPRYTIMGYYVRGARANSLDIEIGLKLGAAAVHHLDAGQSGFLVGMQAGQTQLTNLEAVVAQRRDLDPELVRYAQQTNKLIAD